MIKIMFVCHGNICRSPMAEFIFKDLVEKRGLSDKFYISSSATSTEEIWNGIGNPVYPPAKAELKKHNLSCGDKRAIQLKKSDYDKYDLFVAMDSFNIRNILKIFGNDTGNKVKRIMDYTNQPSDVADPYYTGDFSITYNMILKGSEALLEFLIEKGI